MPKSIIQRYCIVSLIKRYLIDFLQRITITITSIQAQVQLLILVLLSAKEILCLISSWFLTKPQLPQHCQSTIRLSSTLLNCQRMPLKLSHIINAMDMSTFVEVSKCLLQSCMLINYVTMSMKTRSLLTKD